jgi:hypothetical protein
MIGVGMDNAENFQPLIAGLGLDAQQVGGGYPVAVVGSMGG